MYSNPYPKGLKSCLGKGELPKVYRRGIPKKEGSNKVFRENTVNTILFRTIRTMVYKTLHGW